MLKANDLNAPRNPSTLLSMASAPGCLLSAREPRLNASHWHVDRAWVSAPPRRRAASPSTMTSLFVIRTLPCRWSWRRRSDGGEEEGGCWILAEDKRREGNGSSSVRSLAVLTLPTPCPDAWGSAPPCRHVVCSPAWGHACPRHWRKKRRGANRG
jgi:hypothetical protein